MSPLTMKRISLTSNPQTGLHLYLLYDNMRQLLWEQYVHDELFHMDIFSLPMLEKVTHHTLHLTKYYTEIMDTAVNENALYQTRLTDTLSTCLSLFCIFNCVPTLTRDYFEHEVRSRDYEEDYSTLISMLSRFTEQNKHGPSETFSRKQIVAEIQITFCNTLVLMINYKHDPFDAINTRRDDIQKRSIFYEMLHQLYLDRVNILGSSRLS